ncbi:DUF2231 domain-containing protein [Amycolatopsis sp., V23-08]|uniref:DUF2231 domain-containing protein n=1 Tax=Amycolatopsis heterodermiae TaxID=3110235 RepID=A0ABU5RG51_9PSEU|nr:DUF2231 domain-containing protein [Amycolatopsis sp., V23-08]MEA5365251.1 DUF2231 domain-containing protein [Amycolatopsis sp., V23-08]
MTDNENTRGTAERGRAAAPHRLLAAVERARVLDGPAESVAKPLRRLFGGPAGRKLRGRDVGHPLHPLAVTLPIGAWTCSSLLDLLPGSEPAARRLVAAGLLATPAAAVLGWADYSELDTRQRRVGVVHAAANALAAGVFVTSYSARTRGATAAGKLLNVVGLAVLGVGGALGGHLAYAQGAGVFRWQSAGEDVPR